MKNIINKLNTIFKTVVAVSLLSAGVGTYGDDTEVFYSVNVSKPNLLFVLDVSGSMNTQLQGGATGTPGSASSVIRDGADDGREFPLASNLRSDEATILIEQGAYGRLHFTNIDIPSGSEITNAYIQFQAAASDNGEAFIWIWGSSVADAPTNYTSVIYSGDLTNPIIWRPENWRIGDSGSAQRTPNLNLLVQEIVNKPGWQRNNAMTIFVGNYEPNTGNRRYAAFDHATYAPPELHIEYITEGHSRLEVMQITLREVLEQAPDNVKVGLMNYGQVSVFTEVWNYYPSEHKHHAVSGIAFPVTDINAKARDIIPTASDVYGLPYYPDQSITIREYLADVADNWNASSYTPIVDALYEAALYFRGEKMHYGQNLPTINGAHPASYNGAVVTTNISNTSGLGRSNATAPNYQTPIESSCQDNYIVLMTDGAPTYLYRGADGRLFNSGGPFASIRGTSNGPQGTLASAITSCSTGVDVGIQGTCGAEITEYIATHDNLPDATAGFPDGQEGDQFIQTFTVGFGLTNDSATENYLKSLATYDDGNASTSDDGYFLAESPESLAAAFREILDEVAEPKGTLASPGYSVNVKNGLEHENDIYIPVFNRKNSSRWAGNLKKFRLVDVDGKRLIRGKNGVNATDELGGFTTNSMDYWSTSPASTPDGTDVEKGGLAGLLSDPDARNIYSNLTGNQGVALSDAANELSNANISNLTNSVLGLSSGSTLEDRKILVNFMRGWEDGLDSDATPSGVARKFMGDMLHSDPLVVTYDPGVGDSSKEQYIFAGTNEGYIHAFDTTTGEEKFAFIPKELLSTISEPQFLNAGSQVDHKYGIDGSLTADFKRGNDGNLESIIIYFGLRRGGSSFYALDVTDINEPRLLWTKSVADYPSMGQSWSAPYVASIGGSDGSVQEVVIVSGGYDEDEDRDKTDGSGEVDDATANIVSDVGNDILIFDADTGVNGGNLLWSLSSADRARIEGSIPGGVRILDTNFNKKVDRMYFGDTGGNVWRLDLTEEGTSGTSTLTKLASLGGSGSNSRMFFNEPDVAVLKLNGRSVFAVSIGSGFRAHPMDETITDKFYVLIDESPYRPLITTGSQAFNTITEANLAVISVSDGSISKTGSIKDVAKKGWVVNLPESGEKVLGTALAFDGNITFTTLVPETMISSQIGHIDQCASPVTQSRFYAIDILNGTAGLDLNNDGVVTDSDLFLTTSTEILSRPQVIFNPAVVEDVLDSNNIPTGEKTCMHPVDIRTGKKLSQTTGYDACRLESVYWSDPVTKH